MKVSMRFTKSAFAGKPFFAYSIAGCSNSEIGSRPKVLCAANQVETNPGTVPARKPSLGIPASNSRAVAL
ncbi:unannotated protein [freshwater metagenome]|uniref:Unannotated protein n=1 Tax=freshwater metagenome TaxID=449393 RepID=A0A6J6N5P4_9ZZZZ